MTDGQNSDHNVNETVQPNIPVQSRVLATLRLRLTAQRITEGDNMTPSDFNRIRSHVEQRRKKQKPVVTDNKDGVTTSYITDDSGWAFYMEDQDRIVAVLDVGFHKHVYGSYVDAPYRQRGYSTSLYLCAIRILGELKSDDSLGTSALRTWKSVARYHKVELLDYNTDKSVNFEWGPDAMPLLGSKKVPLTKVPLVYFFKASRGSNV